MNEQSFPFLFLLTLNPPTGRPFNVGKERKGFFILVTLQYLLVGIFCKRETAFGRKTEDTNQP